MGKKVQQIFTIYDKLSPSYLIIEREKKLENELNKTFHLISGHIDNVLISSCFLSCIQTLSQRCKHVLLECSINNH